MPIDEPRAVIPAVTHLQGRLLFWTVALLPSLLDDAAMIALLFC